MGGVGVDKVNVVFFLKLVLIEVEVKLYYKFCMFYCYYVLWVGFLVFLKFCNMFVWIGVIGFCLVCFVVCWFFIVLCFRGIYRVNVII